MDWMSRAARPNQASTGHSPAAAGAPRSSKNNKLTGSLKMASVGLMISGAILLLAVIAFSAFSKTGGQEKKYVDTGKYQAVFLNGGQVYFGKIQALNSKYVTLADIYYLRVNQQVQPTKSSSNSNDVSLVKLGCELHGPEDRMLINRDQVVFWENLKTDGQVAKAVADFQKSNPNGQNCAQANSSTKSSTNQ